MSAFAFNTRDLVDRVRRGERDSAELLCAIVRTLSRCHLERNVENQSVDDSFHDVVVTVLEAIMSGTLREPDRLLGFVRTVTRRGVVAHIRANIKRRQCSVFDETDFGGVETASPELLASRNEKSRRLSTLLSHLRSRDRELLVRFYLYDQSPTLICQEMRLTATQFRLYKSRALARCAAAANSQRSGPACFPDSISTGLRPL